MPCWREVAVVEVKEAEDEAEEVVAAGLEDVVAVVAAVVIEDVAGLVTVWDCAVWEDVAG